MTTPNQAYIMSLLERLKSEFTIFHQKIDEIERLRYYEDDVGIAPNERKTNLEIRIGLTAELIESVKAASTANPPRAKFKILRKHQDAQKSERNRENFWNDFLHSLNHPVPTLSELADSQAGLGIGILKCAYTPWKSRERYKRPKEDEKEHVNRVEGLKKLWGPPFTAVSIHPLSFYFRLGKGNKIVEAIEHSYKPRIEIYGQYNINDPERYIKGSTAVTGFPVPTVKTLPQGVSTETLCTVTEYWSNVEGYTCYQVWVDGKLVYEEEGDATVAYFVCTGRSSSSTDIDKFGVSIAEILRHNEPVINRVLTRMAEASDLVVKKRLAVQYAETSIPPVVFDKDTNPSMANYTFNDEYAESLPAGAQVVDPFEGVHNVYGAMPFIELMLQITAQHGVAPIFKGMPPGSAGSGYRDNSLYMMAKAIYMYLLESYQYCIADAIRWFEWCLVTHVKSDVFMNDFKLSPSDVKDWPASMEVVVEPELPQNMIAEGNFYDSMHSRGHISRRHVQEKGLGIQNPEEEQFNRLLEDVQQALMPALISDVLSTVLPQTEPEEPSGLVGPDGQPISSNGTGQPAGGGMGGAQALLGSMQDPNGPANTPGIGRDMGRSRGGQTRGGQPTIPAGALV